MKRLIPLLLIAFLFTGCNLLDNDPDNDTEDIDYFTDDEPADEGPFLDHTSGLRVVTIEHDCNDGNMMTYCISADTYATISIQMQNVTTPCTPISFDDIDGVAHGGYYVSCGSNPIEGCYRSERVN